MASRNLSGHISGEFGSPGFAAHSVPTERRADRRNQRKAGVYMVRYSGPFLKLLTYERVSSARQGKSGHGFDAQR